MNLSTPCFNKCSIIKNKNGLPATGAIHFGSSETTERNLVPKPPANITASNPLRPLKGEL